MITLSQRHTLLAFVQQACSAGARLHQACAILGLDPRTDRLDVLVGLAKPPSTIG